MTINKWSIGGSAREPAREPERAGSARLGILASREKRLGSARSRLASRELGLEVGGGVQRVGCEVGAAREGGPSLFPCCLPATRAGPRPEVLGVCPRPTCFLGSYILRLVSKLPSDGGPAGHGVPFVLLWRWPSPRRRVATAKKEGMCKRS